jgi:formate dehydrogenase major subunit
MRRAQILPPVGATRKHRGQHTTDAAHISLGQSMFTLMSNWVTQVLMDDQPSMGHDIEVRPPETWATGYPAIVSSVKRSVAAMGPVRARKTLAIINQPDGFDCPGCAWPEAPPGERHHIEFCESGAKAVAEEATSRTIDSSFFAAHSLADLRQQSDFWLGQQGRLTQPLVKWPDATHYVPIAWDDAFATIATQLQQLDSPNEAVFYTSGRTSNEAAYLYQLMVRCFGTNNLPDCSNMCHEPTSTALNESIGIGKGSVRLCDFEKADLIMVVGQNPGSNHPRMLTTLEQAKRAGARIIAINPLPEAGLLRFKNPQRLRGVVGQGTAIADLHLPIKLGGDQALFQLWNKWLIDRNATDPGTIDAAFIGTHTSSYDAMAAHLATIRSDNLLAATGLERHDVEIAFEMIAGAKRMIICWAMGVTQHLNAIDTINEFTNLALLGGHIGRVGAGLCPIRGHSNVQGDRTMGIFEKPPEPIVAAIEKRFGVSLPRENGLDTIDAVDAFARGAAKVLIGLGGNFVRATPDTSFTEPALAGAQLSVQISTKLNRSHTICGRTAIILPTLGRTDVDRSPYGDQFVTVEDSMGLVHASKGVLTAPSTDLRSEVTIVCDLAAALLGPLHVVPWTAMRSNNDLVRDAIADTVNGFEAFNERVRVPGGFSLPHGPRDHRTFATHDAKAHFNVTHVQPNTASLLLQTLRSHDQYNTTIYGHDDRYRGLSGDRHIIMLNRHDIDELGFHDGDIVDIVSLLVGIERRANAYRIVEYPTPPGCAAAYYPETNVLIALDHHGVDAQTPAAKAIPIRLEPASSPR